MAALGGGMTAVFISYRRDDHQGFAGRIRDHLLRALGDTVRIDRDIDGALRPGEPFPDEIKKRVEEADVVLAVIGPRWLDLLDERTKLPKDDWVRIELELALSLGKPVIPILLEAASMPAADALPKSLGDLSPRGAMRVRDAGFEDGMATVSSEVRARLAERPAPLPAWMWLSTRESVNADLPSVTAIVETVVAVIAYWWIAITFSTYWPLIVGAATAPFVLLRSNASVAMGVRWWERTSRGDNNARGDGSTWIIFWGTTLAASGASYTLSAWLATTYLSGLSGWQAAAGGIAIAYAALVAAVAAAVAVSILAARAIPAAWAVGAAHSAVSAVAPAVALAVAIEGGAATAALMLGAAIAIAIDIEEEELEEEEEESKFRRGVLATTLLLAPPLWLGIVVGLLVALLLIRLASTWSHLPAGILSMPRNYRRVVLCASPAQEPEVLPGLPDGHELRLNILLREAWNGKTIALLVATAILLFGFLPAWLWRISIKSTAWLWWPIAFLGKPASSSKNPNLYRRLEIDTLWGRTTLVLAVLTIPAFAWLTTEPQALDALPQAPRALLAAMVLPAPAQALPWQWLAPAFGVLSVAIVLWLDAAHTRYDEARRTFDKPAEGWAKIEMATIEIVGRVRALMVLAFIALIGGFMTLTLNARAAPACWFVPAPPVQAWGAWAYGERVPPAPVCGTTGWQKLIAWRGA